MAKSVIGFALEGTGESARSEIKIEKTEGRRKICSTQFSV
jgi:hypothetical protein